MIPFEPALPSLADRGWPQGRLPRTLRGPLGRLADRILAMPGREAHMAQADAAAGARTTAAGSPAPAGPARARRSRPRRRSVAASRPSPVRSALRRLLPSRVPRPRPA